jgi:hypothetical protein
LEDRITAFATRFALIAILLQYAFLEYVDSKLAFAGYALILTSIKYRNFRVNSESGPSGVKYGNGAKI